jgi:hypothetical protein
VSANYESGRDSTVAELANLLIDVAKAAREVKDVEPHYIEPKTFKEAWNHPDPMQRAKWCEAIQKKFRDMIKHKMWRAESRKALYQAIKINVVLRANGCLKLNKTVCFVLVS